MEKLPQYIDTLFIAVTIVTLFFFIAASRSLYAIALIAAWLAFVTYTALNGFYTDTTSIPPHLMLLIAVPLLCILLLFITRGGRSFLDRFDLRWLTALHIVRIPVEIILFLLCSYKFIPQLMTFEGRNFDILSGITAPFILYLGLIRKAIPRKGLILWNIVCLGLLFNIVINAILSVPTPFQKFAFDQPNVAVLYFPYVWLPCCIVPLVLLAHLAALRKLVRQS